MFSDAIRFMFFVGLLFFRSMTSIKTSSSSSSSSFPYDYFSSNHRNRNGLNRTLAGSFPIFSSSSFDPFKISSLAKPISNKNKSPQRSKNTYKLKVASFNIWGLITSKDKSARISAITRYFTKNPRGLDILCLQELWVAEDYRTIRAGLSLEFPHAHYFKSGVVGSGLAIFSKFPIEEAWWKGFTLTGKAHRIFDGDWYAGKGIGAVRIKHPVIGVMDIFNTHLIANYSPSDYDSDWYKAHRATQLYELIRHVDRTSDPNALTIVMGDLNTQPIEDSYKAMIRGGELYTTYKKPLRNIWRDIAKLRGKRKITSDDSSSPLNQQDPDQWTTTTMMMSHENGSHFTCNLRTNSYYKSSMPEQQIDHILYVPDGRIHCINADVFLTHPTRDESGVAGPSYSDHAAIMATFEIFNLSKRVILNTKKNKSKVANPVTQKLMIRLNEEIQGIQNQQWAEQIGIAFCVIFIVSLLSAAVFLIIKANNPNELQKHLQIANAPEKYKWYEKISFNWYALGCLIISGTICLYCQGIIWNTVVFLPQELFAFKEFQYEWALWLRKH